VSFKIPEHIKDELEEILNPLFSVKYV